MFICGMTTMIPPALQEIEEAFTFLETWEERYAYLLDLAVQMPPLHDTEMVAQYRVKGCMAQVWLVPECRDDRLFIRADSDAQLVRGLIAILRAAYDGLPLTDIPQVDIEGAFTRMGLAQNLSPNRRNGFFAMVTAVRRLAETHPDRL